MNTPHPLKKNILIIGAGFSGLTLAALLQKKDIFNIVMYEKDTPGGVLQSETHAGVLIEQAASSFLNHHEIESFVNSYGVDIEKALPQSKKRYIFYEKLSRWPLGIVGTLYLLVKLFKFFLLSNKLLSLKGLTAEVWALQHFGYAFTDRMLRPALFGIYASDISELSAELVFARFLDPERKKNLAKHKSSVIPAGGLSPFLKTVRAELVKNEVQIIKKNLGLEELLRLKDDYIVVFAGKMTDFQELVRKKPEVFLEADSVAGWASSSQKIRQLSLTKIAVFFDNAKNRINGFGVLFHPSSKFKSLGVIANSAAFATYGPEYNESWILKDGSLASVLQDRHTLFGSSDNVSSSRTKNYPDVYPVYDLALLEWIKNTHLQKGFYATGNYWGHLGLTQIFLQNLNLAEKITDDAKK